MTLQTSTISILGKLGGRKFLAMLLALIAFALHNYLGIDQTTTITIGGLIATYILGQSYSDAQTSGATSSTTPTVDPAQISTLEAVTAMADAGHSAEQIQATLAKI